MAVADAYRFPSSLIQDEAACFDKKLQTSFKVKFFIMLHGNMWVSAAGVLLLVASYYFTLSSSPSVDDLFYCTPWFVVLMCGDLFEVFWFTSKERKAELFANVLTTMRKVEQNCSGERHLLEKSYRMIRFLRNSSSGMFALTSLCVCFRRVPDSQLPLSFRGLPLTDPRILTVQAIQCILGPVVVTAGFHFLEILFTCLLCSRTYFQALGNKLKKSKTEEDIHQALKLHRDLLGSWEELFDSVKMWVFSILTVMFLMSQLVTISIIRGSKDPENLLMLPSQMGSILFLCLFGDLLQQSTERFVYLAYSLEWYTASKRCKATILTMMIRSQKPLSLRCPLFGALHLPVARDVYNTWYKFVQLLINLF